MSKRRNFKTVDRECASPGCPTLFRVEQRSRRKYCEEHAGGAGTALASRDPNAPLVRELQRKKDEVTRLTNALKQAHRDEDTAEKVRETIIGIAATSPEPPSWLYTLTKGGAPGMPLTMWSDWHMGEVVDFESMAGLNEFNTPIAMARVEKLAQLVIKLCFEHMVNPQYPGIVVMLGGDMMSGDIHEELSDTNDRYAFQTVQDLEHSIAPALSLLADHFGHVFVPCVVGNHGRNSMKPRMKGVVQTSFEWVVYCHLAKHFENDPRIQFFIPNEPDANFQVYGHRYLLTHGDRMGVKGGDGIIGVIGPIKRGAIKIGDSEKRVGRDFDTIVMGHWHQYMALQGIQVNGALKGYDEYARHGLRVPYAPPIQSLWFQHKDHGITCQWPLLLESSKKAESEWLTWPSGGGYVPPRRS